MINHVRTLLLNRNHRYFLGVYGSQYIPANFYPVVLDTSIIAFRNIVFPIAGNPVLENYIADEIMTMLHAPDLVAYTEHWDPRIAYTPGQSKFLSLSEAPVTVSKLSKNSDVVPHYSVDIRHTPGDLKLTGSHVWSVLPHNTNQVKVKYSRGDAKTVTVTNGTAVSDPIFLLNDYLKLWFDLPSLALTGTFQFDFNVMVCGKYELGSVYENLRQLLNKSGLLARLFKSTSANKTMLDELYSLWLQSSELTIKFGALVLAYLCQCEQLRQLGAKHV